MAFRIGFAAPSQRRSALAGKEGEKGSRSQTQKRRVRIKQKRPYQSACSGEGQGDGAAQHRQKKSLPWIERRGSSSKVQAIGRLIGRQGTGIARWGVSFFRGAVPGQKGGGSNPLASGSGKEAILRTFTMAKWAPLHGKKKIIYPKKILTP